MEQPPLATSLALPLIQSLGKPAALILGPLRIRLPLSGRVSTTRPSREIRKYSQLLSQLGGTRDAVSRATVGAPRSVSSRADGSPASGGKCFIMITREEAKAARKLLCWSQMLLVIEADVSLPALVGFERGQKLTRRTTVLRVQRAFERAGVIFLDDGPVRAPNSAAAE